LKAATDKILGLVTISVACLSPLPYGSDGYGWVCLWLGIISLSLLLRVWSAPLPTNKKPILVVVTGGLALAGLVVLQVSPHVPTILEHPAWQTAANAGVSDVHGRIAIEASLPIYSLALPLAIIAAFLAGYLQAAQRSWCWSLIQAVTVAGLCYAALGIWLGIINPGYVLFERKIAYQTDFTGPFVNRNTAASFFGVCFLSAIVVAFRKWRQNWPMGYLSGRQKFLFLVQNLTSSSSWWSCAAAILLGSVLLTGSRAGAAFSLIAAITVFFLLVRKAAAPRRSLLIIGGAAGLVLVLHLFGTGSILTRVIEGINENGRYAGWASAWRIVADYPLFGTGLGTFKTVFPLYRLGDHGITQIWERAHSTPLEIAVELGVPAAISVIGMWCMAMAATLRSYLREPKTYAMPALGFGILLLTGLHSLVDFPLQVAGCAIPVAILLGAIFRQVLTVRRQPVVTG